MIWALTYFCHRIPPLYTTVSIDYLFSCTLDYRLIWTRRAGSRDKRHFRCGGVKSQRHCTPGSFFPSFCIEGSKKTLRGASVRVEMGPNIFYPRIPHLYTTVSIDDLFACTTAQTTGCFGRGGVPGQKYFRCGGGTVAATLLPQAAPFFPPL